MPLTLLRKVDLVILILIALATGVVSVLDFFGILDPKDFSYPVFTLLLLSAVALHLVVTHFTQEDFHAKTILLLSKLSDNTQLIDLRIYSDSMEIESHLAQRMLEAKKSVRDLTWKAKISEGFSASNRQLAHGYMDKCIAETSDRITYREIFVFTDPRRVEKLERRLSENKRGYSCRYFREDCPIPRLQFVIVDDEEVFFFASAADSILCSIRSRELSNVFRSYYEAAWDSAIRIKEGPRVFEDVVAEIREHFRTPDNQSTT